MPELLEFHAEEAEEAAHPDAQLPARVCVIDVGTNSFHGLIVDAFPNGTYAVVDKIKEMVRLGDKALVSHRMTDAAMQRGVDALGRIRILADGWGVTEYLAFATSAVREAENGGDFIEMVRQRLGIHIRVISGKQEAMLIYKAVRHVVDLAEPALLVDIGGGSTEFIVGDRQRAYHLTSLKIGAARMSEKLVTTDPVKEQEFKRLRRHIRDSLKEVFREARERGVRRIVGSSGTMENLAQAFAFAYGDPNTSIFQQTFPASSFRQLTKRIMSSTREERDSMPGIDRKRVDQVVAGATLLDIILKDLGMEEVVISPNALREGMVLYFIEQNYRRLERLAAFASVRRRSVHEQAYRFRWDSAHAKQVTVMALKIFDACASVHNLDQHARELLEYAALLHDVGYLISRQNHHRHTYYMIRQADLYGFVREEIDIIAAVARYHGGSVPRKTHPEYSRLSTESQQMVDRLAAILRLANGLDRSHFQNVTHLKVDLRSEVLALKIKTKADPQLELWGARRSRELFERTFGRRVEVGAVR